MKVQMKRLLGFSQQNWSLDNAQEAVLDFQAWTPSNILAIFSTLSHSLQLFHSRHVITYIQQEKKFYKSFYFTEADQTPTPLSPPLLLPWPHLALCLFALLLCSLLSLLLLHPWPWTPLSVPLLWSPSLAYVSTHRV